MDYRYSRVFSVQIVCLFFLSCLPGKEENWLDLKKAKVALNLAQKEGDSTTEGSPEVPAANTGDKIKKGIVDAYQYSKEFVKERDIQFIALGSGATVALITSTGLNRLAKSHFTSKLIEKNELEKEVLAAKKANKYPDSLDFNIIQDKYKKSDFQALLIKNNDLKVQEVDRPLLLFYQGFGGSFNQNYKRYFELSKRLETDLVVIDYTRASRNSRQLVDNMTELSRHIMSLQNSKPKNVTLYGYSVGAGVATQVAAKLHKSGQQVYLVADRGFNRLSSSFQGAIRWKSGVRLPEFVYSSVLGVAGWNFRNSSSWDAIPKDYKLAITTEDELIVRSNQLGNDGSNHEVSFPEKTKASNHEASILDALDKNRIELRKADPSVLAPVRDFHLKRARIKIK